MRKRFILLSAYEELTEKESFCINELNFQEISKVQGKKLKLIGELESLNDHESLSRDEKDNFNARIEHLQIVEKENEKRLGSMKDENRLRFKSLSKHVRSASKIRKAYGSASSPRLQTRALKDKA